jgi:hypothetical protein
MLFFPAVLQTVQFQLRFPGSCLCGICLGRWIFCRYTSQWQVAVALFLASFPHDGGHGRLHGSGRCHQKVGRLHQYQDSRHFGLHWIHDGTGWFLCHLSQQEFVGETTLYYRARQGWIGIVDFYCWSHAVWGRLFASRLGFGQNQQGLSQNAQTIFENLHSLFVGNGPVRHVQHDQGSGRVGHLRCTTIDFGAIYAGIRSTSK